MVSERCARSAPGEVDTRHRAPLAVAVRRLLLDRSNLATLYLYGVGVRKDALAAVRWYQFSAQKGDPIGQCDLASLYFVGKEVSKDYGEAARWFRVGAEQGLPAAENDLAFMYYRGQGVIQDYAEGLKWMLLAADHGYAQAQTNLGYIYEQGKGVSMDYVTAYMWYSLASEKDPRAAVRIKSLSRLMSANQRFEAKNRASAWLSSHRG